MNNHVTWQQCVARTYFLCQQNTLNTKQPFCNEQEMFYHIKQCSSILGPDVLSVLTTLTGNYVTQNILIISKVMRKPLSCYAMTCLDILYLW